MKIVVDKRMITELSNKGCKKNVINQMCHKSDDPRYFEERLHVTIPKPDKPPLANLTEEGDLAELYKLEELSYRNVIITQYNSQDNSKEQVNYDEFKNVLALNGEMVMFSSDNRKKLMEKIEKYNITGKDFKIDFSNINEKEILKSKFKEIVNPKKYNYLYQLEFSVDNRFFYPLLGEEEDIDFYNKFNFEFTGFRPDLIKIIDPCEKLDVLDKQLKVVESSSSKIKLQLCDIKMSDFSNTYYIELGLYMMALNKFIFENKLNDEYEVSSSAVIYPQKNNESNDERENRIVNLENTEIWITDFNSIRNSLAFIFRQELPEVIKIIENGDTDGYLNVKVNSKCQTCDYYGGQYSDYLKGWLKEDNAIKKTQDPNYIEQSIDQYLKNPENHFCRYYMKHIKNINIIPDLKVGEKNILLENNIKDLNTLYNEIQDEKSSIFSNNMVLKANRSRIEKEIDIRNSIEKYNYISNRTLNIPLFSNLTVFLDTKKDSQGRTIALAFSYMFYGRNSTNEEIKENTVASPYIHIIDEYTANNEKAAFIDFLIKLNEILSIYDKFTTNYGRAATFSFVYWGEEVFKHLKDLFINVLKYITSKGNEIEEIYKDNISSEIIAQKKKELSKLLYRFNAFFTADDELKDYRVVETSPFFNMKKGVEEILALDIDYNYTLTEVYNKLFNKDFGNYYCKPDSDQFDGGVTHKLWVQEWDKIAEKEGYKHKITNVMKSRLSYMLGIKIEIGKTKYACGTAPEIPLAARKNLFNNSMSNDLYFFHKLDSAYSLVEKEVIHNQDIYSKTVLGKCIYLSEEVLGIEKEAYINKYFENSLIDQYRLYKLDNDSKNANYEETSFGLTIYPSNKSEFIYKKFFSNPQYAKNHILYDEDSNISDLKGINNKIYKDVIGVSIKKFDRIEGYIVIELSNDVERIVDFLSQEYEFDYSKNVVIESVHIDIWEKRLKEALKYVEKCPQAIDILENFSMKYVNNYNEDEIREVFKFIYAENKVPLDDSQFKAIMDILNQNLTLLWGPPGTGKSHTIAHALFALYTLCAISKDKIEKRILIMGNYDPTDNIVSNFIHLIDRFKEASWFDMNDISICRIKSKGRANGNFIKVKGLNLLEFEAGNKSASEFKDIQKQILKQNNKLQIFTATSSQISKVFISNISKKFSFDYVIVDEASQMDVGSFVPALIKISEHTQILLAGDNLQLPPVQKAKIKNDEKKYFGSIFDYYRNEFFTDENMISNLYHNRRSNEAIVDFAKIAFGYSNKYISDAENRYTKVKFEKSLDYKNFYENILDPDKAIVLLSYKDGYYHRKNEFEADQVINIVKTIFEKQLISQDGKVYDIFNFFDKGIGIVAPHKAQKSKIQYDLLNYFKDYIDNISEEKEKERLKEKIIASVDTVEKYQGQQREIMICSYVVGDRDVIKEEEEFIYNKNRLNVIISRARFKAILLVSQELLLNISDDIDIVEDQKAFQKLLTYCDKEKIIDDEQWTKKQGIMNYKLLLK